MRPLLHLLSVVLVLPGTVLAAAFVILGRGIASTMVLLVLGHSNLTLDEMPFLSLGLVASGIGLWFAFTEHPRAQRAVSAA